QYWEFMTLSLATSVIDAVRCAAEMQRAMAERNAGITAERRIDLRVGINLAARLETLAEPGGICVSRVVRDQVRDKLGFSFEDLGEQQVKNIARPVPPGGKSPGSWLPSRPASYPRSCEHVAVTSSAPSSSKTGPSRRDADDSFTSDPQSWPPPPTAKPFRSPETFPESIKSPFRARARREA